MPKSMTCCVPPSAPCIEHRVLIDGLTDKYNALNATVAANAIDAQNRISAVDEATRRRDGDINALQTGLQLEIERRENADESLAARIGREEANREAADAQLRTDLASKQALAEAKSELTADIAAERSAREATDAAVLAERNAREAGDSELSQEIGRLAAKEENDLGIMQGRIDAANTAIATERRDRAEAVNTLRTSLTASVDAAREDLTGRVNRLTESSTAAVTAEATARQTADARLSSQVSTALQSASDANSAVERLGATVEANAVVAREGDAATLAGAKEYTDEAKELLRGEIDTRVAAVFVYRGQRESNQASDLPLDGNKVGDVYNVKKYYFDDGHTFVEGANVVWNGTSWDKLSEDLDLSVFAEKAEFQAAVATLQSNINDVNALAQTNENNLRETRDTIIPALDNRVTALEGRATAIEGAAIALTGRVTAAEDAATALTARVTEAESGIDSNRRHLGEASELLQILNTKASALETRTVTIEDEATVLTGRVDTLESNKTEVSAFNALVTRVANAEAAIGDQSADIMLNNVTVGKVVKPALQSVANEVTAIRSFLGTDMAGSPIATRLSAVEQSAAQNATAIGVVKNTDVPAAEQAAKDYADAADVTLKTDLEGQISEEATLRAQNDDALGQRIDNLAATIANDYALVEVDPSRNALINRAHNRLTIAASGTLTLTLPPTAGENRSRDFTLRAVVGSGVTATLAFAGFGDEGNPTLEAKKGASSVRELEEGVNLISFTETANNIYTVTRIVLEAAS